MDPAWRFESHSSTREGSTPSHVLHSIPLSLGNVSSRWTARGTAVPASLGSTVRCFQVPWRWAGIPRSFPTLRDLPVKPFHRTGSSFLRKGKTCWGRPGHVGVAPVVTSQGRVVRVFLRFRPRSTTKTPRSRACSLLLDAPVRFKGRKEGTRSG